MTRTSSLATSVEEITPHPKKQHLADKGKEKVDSHSSSSVWDNTGLVLTKAQDAFTAEDLKLFSGMPSNKLVGRHIHKLVQVMYLCIFTFSFLFFCIVLKVGSFFQVLGESIHNTLEYLSHEAKVVSVGSRVKALEVENSKLKKHLISAIDKANTIKEKVKVLGDDLRAKR